MFKSYTYKLQLLFVTLVAIAFK